MNVQEESTEIVQLEIQCANEFEKLVFDYCQQHDLETRIKVALSSFQAPFAAQAAGKSPDRVRALAEYSIKQLECQLRLIDALFLKGKKTQGTKLWQKLDSFCIFLQERVAVADRN
jgi:hypothetical protein